MRTSIGTCVYNNLANGVSILGVLPLCLLFLKDGSQYLIPLIVYNNIMDDLDGILAGNPKPRSANSFLMVPCCICYSCMRNARETSVCIVSIE